MVENLGAKFNYVSDILDIADFVRKLYPVKWTLDF